MKTAKKQKVPSYLVVSRAIVNGGDGKILLLQRSKNHTYYPLKWELPGTRFNANEDIIQSIERGVNQEANLIIEISSHRYYCQSRFVTNGKYADLTYLEITAEAKYLAGEVKISPDHQNFAWVKLTDVFGYDLTGESKRSLTQYISDEKSERANLESRLPVLVAARALIKNSSGRYLLLKRSKNDSFGSQWDLPGGKLSSLEVLNELLKREVFEETSLVIKIDQPALYINSSVMNQGKYTGFTFINLVSSAHITSGKIKLSEEHETFGWFSKSEMFNLTLAPHIRLPLTEIFLKVSS